MGDGGLFVDDFVSVIIPMYNAEKYIKRAIDSVLRQTYHNYEILVIDDCSKDQSARIVKELAQKDSRVKYYRQDKNSGAAEARNRGITEARGRYIAFLDSDDIWVKEKLKKQMVQIKKNGASFVFTAYDRINSRGEKRKGKVKIKKCVTYQDLLTKTIITTSTVMFDREKLGNKTMPLRRTGQDYAFWMKLLRQTNAYGIDQVLVHLTRRGGSLSKNKLQNLRDLWEVQVFQEKIPKTKVVIHLIGYCCYVFKKRFFL